MILSLAFNIVNANSPQVGFVFDILNAKIDAQTNPATMRHPQAQLRRL
jgi:hypothetical protein